VNWSTWKRKPREANRLKMGRNKLSRY